MEALAYDVKIECLERRWSAEKAWDWYRAQPWIVGCNFTPSTAINQLELWQADTFDEPTIDLEMGWMEDLGMNAARVFLHNLVFEEDEAGFIARMDRFLEIASRHGIRVLFTLFDDCWHADACLGKQPEPKPGVHNSGWLQCPGHSIGVDESQWPRMERFVKGVILPFAKDERILGWDLYNEPGNGKQEEKSAPLLIKAFQWAREAGPDQPLVVAAWGGNEKMDDLMCRLSDIVTYHYYEGLEKTKAFLDKLRVYGRPIVCTEWLARTHQTVEEFLPWFRQEGIGCMNWGFVAGKTQTIYSWACPGDGPEPDPWFHDLLRPDGTPFRESEAEAFRLQRSLADVPRKATVDKITG